MKYIPVLYMEPIQEGQIPKRYCEKNGRTYEVILEPGDMEEETKEDRTHIVTADGITICTNCGTSFVAYDKTGGHVRNYCPCCGEELI